MDNNKNTGEIKQLPTRREAVITLLLLTGALLLLLIFFEPIMGFMKKWIMPCALLTFTGIRCPLCGGTRCVMALARLDIAEALYYNPIVVVSLIFCLYLYIRLIISCCRRKYEPYIPRIGEKGMVIILAVYLIFFIVRNLPFYQMHFY